ncbi:hypothetical protein GALMADRAFT_216689 [Galerina marginata CBS 339.88]|uniref:Uncharacterized protein n=1 Tax=Galerina marginata (strain CBS 339.88) TaxID=685588 RepID=A0A067S871_GALM3|nr:hypothetical protein GALMADRAFT_216689 [Galerina marginata CBS 339.88]
MSSLFLVLVPVPMPMLQILMMMPESFGTHSKNSILDRNTNWEYILVATSQEARVGPLVGAERFELKRPNGSISKRLRYLLSFRELPPNWQGGFYRHCLSYAGLRTRNPFIRFDWPGAPVYEAHAMNTFLNRSHLNLYVGVQDHRYIASSGPPASLSNLWNKGALFWQKYHTRNHRTGEETEEHKYVYGLTRELPEGISDWEYFDCIGIGHFNVNGFCPIDEDGRSPSGRDVEIRRLDQYDAYGWFYGVLVDNEEGTGMRSEQMCTVCRANTAVPNCNFFVMRGCLEYLRHWLDPSLPPRVAFMETSPSMSLEGELYEIVNSHDEIRDRSNLFPSIRYGDIPKALEQDQFRFLNARKGSRHISCAINKGLRNKELLPALFSDFQCWLTMRPDIWPSPSTSITSPTFMRFAASL